MIGPCLFLKFISDSTQSRAKLSAGDTIDTQDNTPYPSHPKPRHVLANESWGRDMALEAKHVYCQTSLTI